MHKITLHAWSLSTICLLLSACSSNSLPEGTTTSTASATTLNENTLFANSSELDYTAKAEEYRIGIADLLAISVFRADEFSREARVDSEGNLSLPLLGNIKAEGMTPVQMEQRIAELLRQKYLQDPQVTVFVKEYSSQHLTLDGSFKSPGVFPMTAGQVTLIQALALGGGLDELADPSKVVLFRRVGNQTKAYRLDVAAVREGKLKNPYLRNNDIIVAHRSDSRFWLREVSSTMGNLTSILNPLKSF